MGSSCPGHCLQGLGATCWAKQGQRRSVAQPNFIHYPSQSTISITCSVIPFASQAARLLSALLASLCKKHLLTPIIQYLAVHSNEQSVRDESTRHVRLHSKCRGCLLWEAVLCASFRCVLLSIRAQLDSCSGENSSLRRRDGALYLHRE